ncbi:MAG: protease inhibitor I42 family protein [Candidatus Hodarchaeota archaeon]
MKFLLIYFLVFCNEISSMEISSKKVFSIQQERQTLIVKLGESFLLILPNLGSGGYVIREPPEFDPQKLTLQKIEKNPPSDPDKEGDFGSFEWTFRAIEEGFTCLVVRASRPWEKGKSPIVIFEASVQVKP